MRRPPHENVATVLVDLDNAIDLREPQDWGGADAGLQADILTIASMGCHPLSIVTAITVQDTSGVDDVQPVDADWVADQARAVLEDMPVAAFKIGLVRRAWAALLGGSRRWPTASS